jgi:uncharacterized membrane protein
MKISNAEICKILMRDDHLTKEDKNVLLKILGYEDEQEKLSFSARVSDIVTNFIGSWSFILISIIFIAIWVILNSFVLPADSVFDAYPYVLLTLVLSTVAAIQAPAIMMSQNRQDQRESLKTQNDYEIDLKTIVIIQDLYLKVNELYDIIQNINNKLDDQKKE